MDKRIIALVLAIAAAAAAAGALQFTAREGGGGSQQATVAEGPTRPIYTLPLSPGSELLINSTVSFRSGNSSVNSTLAYLFHVSGVEWPLVVGNYTILGGGNESSIAAMVFANLALPRELLGEERVAVPLTIPFAGDSICVELSLVSGGGNYTYKGRAGLPGVSIDILLVYDSRGLMVHGLFNITIKGGRGGFTLEQWLVNSSLAGPVKMEAERGWVCDPPFSSNVMFVWDGFYILSPDGMVPVDARDVRAAVLGDGVVAVIYKDGRNLTNEFWRNLNRAVKETGQDVYVVIVGGLASRDVQIIASDILGRASAVEGNVAIRFENGRAVMKVYSFAPYEELVALLEGGR